MQPKFEIVQTTTGAISIRNNVVNEIMHNPVGPWLEANQLYIEQSRLSIELSQASDKPLVLFDVGLGAATNAVAAIRCAEELGPRRRPLHIVSFENDFSLLQFAIDNADSFPYFEGLQQAMRRIDSDGAWSGDGIVWEAMRGDFRQRLGDVRYCPEIIFFDPYSPAVNSEMWSVDCFARLHQHCKNLNAEAVTRLFTYSQATPIRVAMLLAGFFVGHGRPTGLKEETTQASTHLSGLVNPLAERWFARWSRSHTKLPLEADPQCADELIAAVRMHPQFQNLRN